MAFFPKVDNHFRLTYPVTLCKNLINQLFEAKSMATSKRKPRTKEQHKMDNATKGLGIGQGVSSMVQSQSHRNSKKLNLGPQTDKQKEVKMKKTTTGLGIGQGVSSMVHNQSARNGRNRGHGELTLDQAYDLTAELLIRQRGKCWVTGTDLVINGYADDVRSYSIDRLNDSKGYSVGNCRAVCVWVNTATARYPKPDQKLILWRSFQKLPTEATETEYPDFYEYYADPLCLRSFLETDGKGSNLVKKTQARARQWLTYFGLPPIVPLSGLTDQEVLELFA